MFIIKKKFQHHDEKRDYEIELQMKMQHKFQHKTGLLLMKHKSITRFKFLILYDYNVIDKNRNIKSAKIILQFMEAEIKFHQI